MFTYWLQVGGENNVMNPKVKGEIGMYVNSRPKIKTSLIVKTMILSVFVSRRVFEHLEPGRTLRTGSNTKNRVEH